MTELLQSGHHPDADQICAFVEHALPAHERAQMLDHLAACPECRATVALSLPPVEESHKPAEMPARRAWLSGWAVAWPAAAAVVALASFAVFVHHAANTPDAAVSSQIAGTHLPPSPVTPAASKSSAAGTSASGSGIQTTAVHPAGGKGAAFAGERRTTRTMQSRNALEQGRIVQPAPSASFGAASSANSVVVLSNGTGSGGGLGNGAGDGYGPGMGAIAGSGANSTGLASIQLKSMGALSPTGTTAQPQAAPAVAERGATGESFEMTGGSLPMATEVTNASGNIETTEREVHPARLIQPLPSRRPVLSMVARDGRVLAVDTHNKVFLSADGGQHWKAVHVVWRGRAVRVELTGFPIENRDIEGQLEKVSQPVSAAGNIAPAASAKAPTVVQAGSLRVLPGSGVSGTVSDATGAAIPGATVTISETTTRESRTVKTDSAGHYVIEQLAPGTYRVEAQAPGFMTRTNAAVAVVDGTQSVANLSLAIGSVSQQVEVSTAAPSISTESVHVASMNSLTSNAGVGGSESQNAGSVALFEITTEKGDRWTSSDGASWTRLEARHPASK